MNVSLFVWRVVSRLLPRSRIIPPENFKVFYEVPPEPFLSETVQAFRAVYALPPWNEEWASEAVETKLRREVSARGVIALLFQEGRVAGFSWGAVTDPEGIIPRVVASFPKQVEEASRGLTEGLLPLLPDRFFFWDEIALLPEARGGLEPIRWLTLPVLQFAWNQGVRGVLFRSTPEAKIVRLTRLLGFQVIWRREVRGLEEIYLFLSDLKPILTLAQRVDSRQVAKVMKLLSKITKAKS